MRHPLVPLTAAAALSAAGCGGGQGAAAPPACQADEGRFVRALRVAPEPVRLAGGTPISACVAATADSDAMLQSLGLTLSSAAERLARAGDAAALGYLVGAARRGSEAAAGIPLELVRRLESAARQVEDRAALQRGLEAGEATG